MMVLAEAVTRKVGRGVICLSPISLMMQLQVM